MAAFRPNRVVTVLGLVLGTLLMTALGAYALVVFVVGGPPSWTATKHVCQQPVSLSYDEFGPYEVIVAERSGPFTLANGPPYAVVGLSGNDGSYGVVVELNDSTDPARVTCRWEPDRVEIVEPNGIVHSVPARVFTGGR